MSERKLRRRLTDTEVPNGALFVALGAARVRQLVLQRPLDQLRESISELGALLGTRMLQSDQRSEQLLALQRSLEEFARGADERDTHLVGLQESIERMAVAADSRDQELLILQKADRVAHVGAGRDRRITRLKTAS